MWGEFLEPGEQMRSNRLRRRELITLVGGALATSVAWPLAARAQQAGKLPPSAGVTVMPRAERALVAAEITPRGGKEREAARALQAMGFRVHAVGATISVDAPPERWKAAFAARFAPLRRRVEKRRTAGATASAQRESPVAFQVPAALEPLVESVVFVEPPELF
jgi:hypothetical protein